MFVVSRSLLVVSCLSLFVACCALCVCFIYIYCLPFVVLFRYVLPFCLAFVAGCWLRVDCCVLFVVCWLAFEVWRS